MADIDFNNADHLLEACAERVRSHFLAPVAHMRGMWNGEGLFASVLVCSTTVEFLSFLQWPRDDRARIARWLAEYVPVFRDPIGRTTLAHFFEQRYRHHIAHNAYVSLGRLAEFDGVVRVDGDVVSVNPFALAREIGNHLDTFIEATRREPGRQAMFVFAMRELFAAEVALAQRQGGF